MSILSKKGIIGLATGVVLFAGTMSPFVAQASSVHEGEDGGRPPMMDQHRISPDKVAQNLSDTFGIAKDDILDYVNEGVGERDLSTGCFLAKASDKSLKAVMNIKMKKASWHDVGQSLGITKEQMESTGNEIAANRLESKLKIAKKTGLGLLQDGYQPNDIALANELAANSKKSINDVLAMKKMNNTWEDVADSLNIDESTFRNDIKIIRDAFFNAGEFPGQHNSFSM
jgi:hypothetical protein